jgi:hypothetical protein
LPHSSGIASVRLQSKTRLALPRDVTAAGEDIVDLYNRTPIGAKVVVFGTGKPVAAAQ